MARKVMSMAFTEITILSVDCAHAEESLRSRNDMIVPYILSNTPPEEWKGYFEEQAPASANVKIVGNTVRYKCPKDKVAIQRDGACWTMVASLVEDANRYYLESELRRAQDRQKKEREEEQQPREFEMEWDRYMSRD
ncbi:MAG: hypothetical protein WB581_05430 [Halobacteriota archaeon]